MSNQPPLNPDALRAALAWFAQAVAEVEVKHADQGTRPGDYWNGYRAAKNEIADLLAEPKLIEKATNAGLAAAQPVVNSVDPRELNRKGWTCGCEPGDYDECDDCLTAAHELANFLNRPEVKP